MRKIYTIDIDIKNEARKEARDEGRPAPAARNWVREDLKHVRRAADRGNRDAAYELGSRLLAGRNVERDPQAARDWMRYAARKGDVRAQLFMGYSLVRGLGGSLDGEAAIEWFLRAAKQGSAIAWYNLAYCCLAGIGVECNASLARQCLAAASRRGYRKADAALAHIDRIAAARAFRRSA